LPIEIQRQLMEVWELVTLVEQQVWSPKCNVDVGMVSISIPGKQPTVFVVNAEDPSLPLWQTRSLKVLVY